MTANTISSATPASATGGVVSGGSTTGAVQVAGAPSGPTITSGSALVQVGPVRGPGPVQPVQGPVDIVPDSVKATLIFPHIPGEAATLNVTLEALVTVGTNIEFVSATPQGINPQIKLLRIRVHTPTGPHSDAIIQKTFSYQESPAQADYSEVTLESGGPDVTVAVNVLRPPLAQPSP